MTLNTGLRQSKLPLLHFAKCRKNARARLNVENLGIGAYIGRSRALLAVGSSRGRIHNKSVAALTCIAYSVCLADTVVSFHFELNLIE